MAIPIDHNYKILLSTWGIAVAIKGEITFTDNADIYETDTVHKLKDDYWCQVPQSLDPNEVFWIIEGINSLYDDIKYKNVFCGRGIFIRIFQVVHNYCDYQEDGLKAAIIDAVSETLDLDCVKIEADFDKTENKYVFKYTKIT